MLLLQPCFIPLINLSLSVHLNSVSHLILTNSVLQAVFLFFYLFLALHQICFFTVCLNSPSGLASSCTLTCVSHGLLLGPILFLFIGWHTVLIIFYLAISFHHYYYLDYIQLYFSFNHALVSLCLNYCKTLFTSVTQDKS